MVLQGKGRPMIGGVMRWARQGWRQGWAGAGGRGLAACLQGLAPKRQLQASCGPAASPAGQLWAGRKPPRHLAPTPAPPPAAAVLLAQAMVSSRMVPNWAKCGRRSKSFMS